MVHRVEEVRPCLERLGIESPLLQREQDSDGDGRFSRPAALTRDDDPGTLHASLPICAPGMDRCGVRTWLPRRPYLEHISNSGRNDQADINHCGEDFSSLAPSSSTGPRFLEMVNRNVLP